MHMRYIPIEQAEPAMILARNIWGPNGQLLLTANTVLRESYISRLRNLQYSAVYVKSYPDEPVENILEPVKQETIVQATLTLKSVAEAAVTASRLDLGRVLEVVSDIVDQVLSNRNVVYSIADIRSFDDYTYGHSVDVCVLAVMCAAEMRMTRYDLLDLGTGAMLHDLGKLFTPKAILSKETPLLDEEWDVIKRHPWDGFQMLRKQVPLMPAHVAFQHHERYDGSGYPRGLTDCQTLDIAKVTAVADSFNAMTSDRPYRKALMPHEALPILAREAGKSYNPDVLRAFIGIVAAYPLGTVVKLSDGSVATVVGVTRELYDVEVLSGPREGNHVSIQHERNESDIHIIERID